MGSSKVILCLYNQDIKMERFKAYEVPKGQIFSISNNSYSNPISLTVNVKKLHRK